MARSFIYKVGLQRGAVAGEEFAIPQVGGDVTLRAADRETLAGRLVICCHAARE